MQIVAKVAFTTNEYAENPHKVKINIDQDVVDRINTLRKLATKEQVTILLPHNGAEYFHDENEELEYKEFAWGRSHFVICPGKDAKLKWFVESSNDTTIQIETEEFDFYPDLTRENAHLASTIISKAHPEWGVKKFNYRDQSLPSGAAHSFGAGSNSAVLFDEELKFWSVVSFKN
ncbi:MAG: hypothetical protein ABJH04_08100 [Cyclobacteriaceae bacterium]